MSQRDQLIRAARFLHKAAGAPRKLPSLFFFTDDRRVGQLADTVAMLPRGVGVIFRHYGHPDRLELAARIAPLCQKDARCLLIAGSPEIAHAVNADGVHWPEAQFQKSLTARRPTPPGWIVTTAVHSLTAILKLRGRPVDIAFLSPLFPTESHPDTIDLHGPVRAAALARASSVPLFGLGGISAETASRLRGTGLTGCGSIGALLP